MNIEIANRLVQLRKQNHLSQEELAAKIGISRQAVSKWERAEASPDTDNLILLARLYGVSLDELLRTEEEIPVLGQPTEPPEAGDDLPPDRNTLLLKFPYPVFVVILYLLLGFLGGYWHPGWIVFLTIPLYYCIAEWYSRPRR